MASTNPLGTPHENDGHDTAPVVVALADDDPSLRALARRWVELGGFVVREFSDGRSLLDDALVGVSVVLLDLGLGDLAGDEVLRRLHARDPDLAIVVVTARRELDSAVHCMRLGASDYLAKPLDRARLEQAVRAAVERQREADRARLRRATREPTVLGTIIGASPAMREMAAQVERVLESEVTVCLMGESGSGKEVVARAIHEHGRRRRGPFVAVNCGAIPASLQESELFGHERGAFTGAATAHRGHFERADGGTLFLDELGEMAPATQVVLLRVLQERAIRRVGGGADIPVDVRILCATHRDLEADVEAGRFRRDLYYRLVVYPVEVPPLRARRDDLPLLVSACLRRFRADVGREVNRVSPDALDAMARYAWPGNVRELQNVIHRAMLSTDGDEITLAHLPPAFRRAPFAAPPDESVATPAAVVSASPDEVVPLAELERRAITHAMKVSGGGVSRAAKLLGMSRTTLYRRLSELEISADEA
jgi:DNA-binding NtrC family response regulator